LVASLIGVKFALCIFVPTITKQVCITSHLSNIHHGNIVMTDPVKKAKNASQDAEAKLKTSEDHAEGKPSSETVNKAKVKARDALT
jgi:hypothetical protein